MARKDFDTTEYHGGRVTPDLPKPRMRYPCFASECPQPGTLFANGTDKAGSCVYHWGVVGHDIPRVTQILKDWDCVAFEVREARRALSNPDVATHPSVVADRYATAWERLEPLAGDFVEQLRPSTIKHRDANGERTVDTGMREDYGDWAKRLEAFLGARVVEALGVRRTRPERTTRAHAFAPLPTPAPNAGEIALEHVEGAA